MFGYGYQTAGVTTAPEKARREFLAHAAAIIRQTTTTDLAVTRAQDLAAELERRNIAPWQVVVPP